MADHSNRTIDYITYTKPEAYQAHTRRVSAGKVAKQSSKKAHAGNQAQQRSQQQEKDHTKAQESQEESNLQQMNNMTLHSRSPPPTGAAYGLHANADSQFPTDMRVRQPKFNAQYPSSAPAAFHSSEKKDIGSQGEIQIGIEPALTPSADVEMEC